MRDEGQVREELAPTTLREESQVNVIDIAGWAACAVVLVGCVLVGAHMRRTGRVAILAGLLGILAVNIADDASSWWAIPIGLLLGWHAGELGKELRKGGAK